MRLTLPTTKLGGIWNRQPAGVLALPWTTFRLHHHPGVRTLAQPRLVRSCSGGSAQPTQLGETSGILYFIPSYVNKKLTA